MTEFDHLYTVSTLNAKSAALLSTHFGFIHVTGEISNLSRPASGHLYFSLKDQNAQIRCALFRFQNTKMDFALENGQQVIVHAQVSLYEPRGDYQLIVKSVQLAGVGALQIAFDQLKAKLEKAGLFDEKYKKPLPLFPKKIGIITSESGAALQDILKVLRRRFPAIPVLLYPTLVQGVQAATQITEALMFANQDKQCDVIILARGGGSLEDLWSFNEEIVAQAIFKSDIPIITGIGHQTDFTIADFVADVRAPTPSAAAETVTPDCEAILKQLQHFQQRLMHVMLSHLQSHQTQLQHLQKRLQHPKDKLQQQAQQLDQLENHLYRIMQFCLQNKRSTLPTQMILEKLMMDKIHYQHEKLTSYAKTFDALSPLKVLKRGFSVTKHKQSGAVITQCSDVKSGDMIVTQLRDGQVESCIIGISDQGSGINAYTDP